jgi:hypothetical protein
MKRIRTMTQIIKAVFLIYVFVPGLIEALFHVPPLWFDFFGIPSSKFSEIPTTAELMYALGGCLYLMAIVTFYRLLNLYERGTIFTMSNARLYQQLGLLAVGYGALDAFCPNVGLDMITHLKLFLYKATGSPWIVIGLFVVLISFIMKEACKMREEQELTV